MVLIGFLLAVKFGWGSCWILEMAEVGVGGLMIGMGDGLVGLGRVGLEGLVGACVT